MLHCDTLNKSREERELVALLKRVGFSMDVMQKYACLVINPITDYSYGFLFNCTTVGQVSHSDDTDLNL